MADWMDRYPLDAVIDAAHASLAFPRTEGETMSHRCPNRCHYCPLMGGDIMPSCMGTAALARGPRDKSHCTCSARSESDRLEDLGREVKKLKATVTELLRKEHV